MVTILMGENRNVFNALIGETFARETFASQKTRKFSWINFRDLTNRRNFAR